MLLIKLQSLTNENKEIWVNDWGMIEDKEDIDFDNLMTEDISKKEQELQKFRRDEELAKRLREEEIRREEEILLQNALKESLAEYNRQQSNNIEYQESLEQSNSGSSQRRKKRGGKQQQTPQNKAMVWVPKSK